MKNSSARHTSKIPGSSSVKKQHGMKLRSDKKGSIDDLCKIISQRDKENGTLRNQKKRLQAAIAAKDKTIEKVSAKLEEFYRLAALYGLEHIFGTAEESFEVPEEQIPQGSAEQTVETSRLDIYGSEEVSGMVHNGTTSPVAADIPCQAAEEIDKLSQTTTGESPLEDPADNPFEVREEQNPQVSGEKGNGHQGTMSRASARGKGNLPPHDAVTIPVAPDFRRMLIDMPTAVTSRPEIDGFKDVSPFNVGMARRRDKYGPEVEGSLGMVRHGTTSPAVAHNSRQVVGMELEIMPQTGLRFHRHRRRFRELASALEDPADNSFGTYENTDKENEEQGSRVGPSSSGRMPLGERRRDNTISQNLKQVRINDTSAVPKSNQTPRSKQTPKSSTIPFSPLADISEAYNSTAPAPLPLSVSYSGSSQTVRSWNINMDQGAGTLAELHGVDLQEPSTFEMYEDPDAENEEQGSPVRPSSSGRMPLGERQREGTITRNPNVDQDADTADRSFEVPDEQNPQDSGEHGNGDVVMPVATDAGRIFFDMPTAKTSRGKKRLIEEDEDDNQSRKKFRD